MSDTVTPEATPGATGATASTRSKDRLYAAVRAILFELDPERAHDLTLALLDKPWLQDIARRRYGDVTDAAAGTVPDATTQPLGIGFRNRVGLAAGLDKNGDHIDALGALGFGSLELGTVTPRPQPGNPSPRMFRLPTHGALINRMGFNNLGVDHLVQQVARRRWRGPIGINIGKNASTPIERANDDYLHCLARAYPYADWITINISSPNTADLRALQFGDPLHRLLEQLVDQGAKLATRHGRHVPLAVKIAPDMDDAALDTFCEAVRKHGIDAVISGNTTSERGKVIGHVHARERGGLSGAPLRTLADEKLSAVSDRLSGSDVALIGVGGISTGQHAAHKVALGADLVQLYTGFIYRGPRLIHDAVIAIDAMRDTLSTND